MLSGLEQQTQLCQIGSHDECVIVCWPDYAIAVLLLHHLKDTRGDVCLRHTGADMGLACCYM